LHRAIPPFIIRSASILSYGPGPAHANTANDAQTMQIKPNLADLEIAARL